MKHLFIYPLWRLGRRHLIRFIADAERVASVQARYLQRVLTQSKGSAWHQFLRLTGSEDVAAFRQRVPIMTYDDHESYVQRAIAGEVTALFSPGTRIEMFAVTSGTTGKAKYIPVTAQGLQEYTHSWVMWGLAAADDHRTLPFGPILSLTSGWRGETTPGGVYCGSISGFLSQRVKSRIPLLRGACPGDVADVQQHEDRLYLAARAGAHAKDLVMITTANPSSLVAFARTIETHQEALLRDWYDGTNTRATAAGLNPKGALAHAARRRDRSMARRLTAAAAAEGRLTPRHIWPELALLGVWTGGTLTPYLGLLPQYYGEAALRDHGLSASEGHLTVPLADGSVGGMLNHGGAFFEFLPVDGSSNQGTLLPQELRQGGEYTVVITTAGGLCRYNLGDVVRCNGWVGQTPTLEFLNRGRDVASITGEKLTAKQVAMAADTTRRRFDFVMGEFVLALQWGDPPRYVLVMEQGRVPKHLVGNLARDFDATLAALNVEYDAKRRSGRIRQIALAYAPIGSWQTLRAAAMERGGTAEQYKHRFLTGDQAFLGAIKGLVFAEEEVTPWRTSG